MIDGLKPYAEMKDSGVEWLDAVPAHWEVRRLKYLLRERDSRSRTGDEQLLRVSQYTGITERKRNDGAEGQDTRAASLIGYKIVDKRDLAVNIMLAWNGSLGVSPYAGIVSPAYGVYRFNPSVEPMFFHHLLRSPSYKARIKTASRGVVESRLRLYTDDLFRVEALLPPKDEQTAIVRFLDHADRRIRRAIAAKQKLIRLLEEQKRAIIHRAVTRGLDPDVRLKPSGIKWLGDVPAHWDVLALKRVLHRLVDCEHKTAPAVDESDFRVIRTSAVRSGRIRWEGTYCTTPEAFSAWTKRAIPEAGDVIFTREAPVGEACVIPPDCAVCLGQRTVLMKVDQRQYRPEFLVHMIYEGPPSSRIRLASQGSTVGHFNMDDIGWMPVLRPPVSEQEQILEFIRRETLGIERAIVTENREVQFLREYRTRLFADVVTGKLDVREAVATLPESIEPEDNELDDDEESEVDSIEDIAAEDQAA